MFLRTSDEVEMYPDRSLSNFRYRNMSIYRNITFPYVIPMARTIRVPKPTVVYRTAGMDA